MSTHNISKNGSLLNRAVLVLNTNYAPLEICSARRAICLYYLDKVDILIKYNDVVHSPSVTLKIPSVIKLKDFIRYNSMELILSRRNIFHRDNYTCQYCKVRGGYLEADHIKPFAFFPELRFVLSNGRTLCRKCHNKTKISAKQMRKLYANTKESS